MLLIWGFSIRFFVSLDNVVLWNYNIVVLCSLLFICLSPAPPMQGVPIGALIVSLAFPSQQFHTRNNGFSASLCRPAPLTSPSSHLFNPQSSGFIAWHPHLAVPLAFTSQWLHTTNNRFATSLWCPAPLTLLSSRFFPPSTFRNHSPSSCIWLGPSPPRPSVSTLQINRAWRPSGVLHTSRCPHLVFAARHLLASPVSRPNLAGPLETTKHSKTHGKPIVYTECLYNTRQHLTSLLQPLQLHDLAPRSGSLISLPNPQSWNNTNWNSKFGLFLNFQDRIYAFHVFHQNIILTLTVVPTLLLFLLLLLLFFLHVLRYRDTQHCAMNRPTMVLQTYCMFSFPIFLGFASIEAMDTAIIERLFALLCQAQEHPHHFPQKTKHACHVCAYKTFSVDCRHTFQENTK